MQNLPTVSFTKRCLAIMYDLILLIALLFIASAIALVLNNNQPIPAGNLLMVLWLLLVGFLYYGVSWKISGQTLGLRTWRLRLVKNDGSSLDWQTIIWRYFLSFILFLSVVGFIWALFNRNRLTAYDILSHTHIIDEKNSSCKNS